MRIQELWDIHRGQDIFIVGSGPSLRCFPIEFLFGRIVLGLNQAYRAFTKFPPTYMVTVHPDLYLEWKKSEHYSYSKYTKWVVKRKTPLDKISYDDPDVYVFDTNDGNAVNDFKYLENRVPDKLYQGRGVQVTAMTLAAHMGAKNIILVGCDMCQIGRDHHANEQHVRFHGLRPAEVYGEYRRFTAKARRRLREKFGANVMTLSPFVGLGHPDEDYARLCEELALAKLPQPRDTSTYRRAKVDQ